MIPLNKLMAPSDVAMLDFTEALAVVDQQDLTGQAACRRWEYAQALRAQEYWFDHAAQNRPIGRITDVGGSGSPLHRMVGSDRTWVVDPKANMALDQWVQQDTTRLSAQVYCLSVIEHVADLDQFLYHLSCLVAPGGLLVLTTDVCDSPKSRPDDVYHYHWMRTRIFSRSWLDDVISLFNEYQFRSLTGVDLSWTVGMENWGYTVASLAFVKRR